MLQISNCEVVPSIAEGYVNKVEMFFLSEDSVSS